MLNMYEKAGRKEMCPGSLTKFTLDSLAYTNEVGKIIDRQPQYAEKSRLDKPATPSLQEKNCSCPKGRFQNIL